MAASNESLTAQEVFDRVVERLFDGTGCAVQGNGCAYLTEEGLKCAVGIFIPDGHKAQGFNGYVEGLLRNYPELRDGPVGLHVILLSDLQDTHDDGASWNGRKVSKIGVRRLEEVAAKRGLTLTLPEGR